MVLNPGKHIKHQGTVLIQANVFLFTLQTLFSHRTWIVYVGENVGVLQYYMDRPT